MSVVPHNVALGLKVVEWGPAGTGQATMELPYDEKLIGNPDTGVIHGGAITALLDACCGAAVFAALEEPIAIATLDLRIDYLKPATPSKTVIARANCYKKTSSVAFVRCLAFHDEDDPIAHAAGAFMLRTK